MKWNYLKGGEKDFEGAPDWATEVVWTDKGGDQLIYWLDKISRRAQMPMCPEFQWDGNYGWRCFVKAERVEVGSQTTPKHLMIFGDPKSFIFAHDEATHAARNKVTGELIHTHIPQIINLSKFDFIAQRQLTDVTEGDLNECIGASEAINLNPDVVVRAGEIHFNGREGAIPTGLAKRVKIGSLHLDGKGHVAPLGNKYMREIAPGVWVDVYAVLKAWNVTNPALQHLIKKALQPGDRGHKTIEQDMQDIIDSAIRAKELEIK